MTSAPRQAWGDLVTTAFVESSHLFKALDVEARQDLLKLAQVVDFSAGEVVSGEGEETFVLLREGTGAVFASRESGAVELYRIERGAFYGVGRVLGQALPSWLTAVSDVTVVVFPAPIVAAMVERFPKARKLLDAVRTARLREAAGRQAS
jgi:CRP-like cAMP-binding protein